MDILNEGAGERGWDGVKLKGRCHKEPERGVGWGQIEGSVSRDRYFERRSRRGGWDGVKLKGQCHETDVEGA
jgi:hypothetical protein